MVDTYNYQHKIRFIDVGTVEEPIFRLVDGQSLVNRTGGIQYVTLSYRWTAETEITSMKSYNKASYQDSIPTYRLPQVYKDAAAVARALGVRYVWIYSLCIIQDSPEDWNEQSSMMDQTSASSSSGGVRGTWQASLFRHGSAVDRQTPSLIYLYTPKGSIPLWGGSRLLMLTQAQKDPMRSGKGSQHFTPKRR